MNKDAILILGCSTLVYSQRRNNWLAEPYHITPPRADDCFTHQPRREHAMSAPVFPSFQSSCRVGSQMTTITFHHQHRRKTASPVRSAVLPSRQTSTCMCKAFPMGTPVRKGHNATAHNALTPLLLIAAAVHPLWKPWSTTSVLSFEHLCFQLALPAAVRRRTARRLHSLWRCAGCSYIMQAARYRVLDRPLRDAYCRSRRWVLTCDAARRAWMLSL
jgi:hypothetical protein